MQFYSKLGSRVDVCDYYLVPETKFNVYTYINVYNVHVAAKFSGT